MKYNIQTIVLPEDDVHLMCRNLFYNGENGYLDTKEGTLSVAFGQQVDFMSYLNSCSWAKWKELTSAKSVSLSLDIEGPCRLRYLGFKLVNWELVRVVYDSKIDEKNERREIVFDYPDNNETIIGVEINPLADCKIYGGHYSVECSEDDLNEVNLGIATTTCRKEDYIRKNVALIKRELLEGDDEIRDHLYLHVVDNGNTLKNEEIEGRNTWLHPNPNTGGSGGYARGMMECLHQEPELTHALLMDDDVLVLTESIRRTYKLLRLLKPEYKEHFISGAMLRFEKPMIQHEDIGTIRSDGIYESLKPGYNMFDLYSIVKCAGSYFNAPHQYAGWWYCCIPVSVIKKNGLPLPLFIRGDDSEYSIRCDAKILSLNGICIWHQGFDIKYNAAMDLYQMARNLLIMQAVCGKLPDVDFFTHYQKQFRISMEKFAYNEMELLLRAFEDYMKGPEFLTTCDGEKILKENAAMNEKLEPLNAHPEIRIREIADVFADIPGNSRNDFIKKLTHNGQRFMPSFLYRSGCPVAAFGWAVESNKICLVKEYAAVNPFDETVVIRRLDKAKYKDIMKRYKSFLKDWKKRSNEVYALWNSQKDRLTSEEFWIEYLGLNK